MSHLEARSVETSVLTSNSGIRIYFNSANPTLVVFSDLFSRAIEESYSGEEFMNVRFVYHQSF